MNDYKFFYHTMDMNKFRTTFCILFAMTSAIIVTGCTKQTEKMHPNDAPEETVPDCDVNDFFFSQKSSQDVPSAPGVKRRTPEKKRANPKRPIRPIPIKPRPIDR